ncbi:MAG: adenosine kinase [Planctomycetaceae bacterium]|nr:adenosine kinase [Planctomycetaceae bacterium]
MQYDVYGVGNALVDIQARVSDATLEKLGFAKGIMTLVDEETQQKVLGELDGAPISQCAGGSAANTVLGVADFGGKAAYAGKVASDRLGEFDLADMRKLGVTIDVEPSPEGHTGTCVVLITEDAQRTMLTNLGVSASLSVDDLNEEHIKQSKYVYVEGYLFTGETQKQAAYRAIELAKKHDVKVAFTVSDPFLINLFRDEFQELIEGPVDLLFCNLEEARSLTGKHDAVDCAHIIHKHVPNLALTLGPDGSILMHEGRIIPIEGVETKAIDTTGAGDMYAAGILYGVTNGLSWHQAGHLASHAAARIVSQLGARLKRPFTEEDIKELLR